MNNLHRELAPISEAAWDQIEDEVARTFKRYVAGRRVVERKGTGGSRSVRSWHGSPAPDSGIAGRRAGPAARGEGAR